MRIKFWGCRGSIPVPDGRMIKYGGNTTCVEIEVGGKTIIIDAGTGIRKLGEDLEKRAISEVFLFITHSHWDHIQGFPFFKPIYESDMKINVCGSTKSYRQLKDILSQQMSYEFFPVRFSELKSDISFMEIGESAEKLDGIRIKTIHTNHTVYTMGIRIESNGSSFVFITDNELKKDDPETGWEEFVQFCSGATYLVHDAQFTEKEYKKRAGWGHSSFEQVVELAKEAGVLNLGFFHHDPDRMDSELDRIGEEFISDCRKKKCGFNVFVMKEQDEIFLDG